MSVASPALRAIQLGAAPMLPRSWKLRISRGFGELTSARVHRQLARLIRGRGPIVAGPWLGEVGFELLYWIPFLAWFAERFDVPRERLVVMSRCREGNRLSPAANFFGSSKPTVRIPGGVWVEQDEEIPWMVALVVRLPP